MDLNQISDEILLVKDVLAFFLGMLLIVALIGTLLLAVHVVRHWNDNR